MGNNQAPVQQQQKNQEVLSSVKDTLEANKPVEQSSAQSELEALRAQLKAAEEAKKAAEDKAKSAEDKAIESEIQARIAREAAAKATEKKTVATVVPKELKLYSFDNGVTAGDFVDFATGTGRDANNITRCSLGQYVDRMGKKYPARVTLHDYFMNQAGQHAPTQKRVSFSLEMLPDLIKFLQLAEAEAKRQNLT